MSWSIRLALRTSIACLLSFVLMYVCVYVLLLLSSSCGACNSPSRRRPEGDGRKWSGETSLTIYMTTWCGPTTSSDIDHTTRRRGGEGGWGKRRPSIFVGRISRTCGDGQNVTCGASRNRHRQSRVECHKAVDPRVRHAMGTTS